MTDSANFSQSLDRLKESFLWAAAQGGKTSDVDSLIEIGADINWKGPEGDTPLLAAARKGHTETISMLLVHGADANSPGDDGFSPIHVASRRGDYETVNILLQANASIISRNKEGMTALDIAKSKGFDEIYERLLQQKNGHKSHPANSGFNAFIRPELNYSKDTTNTRNTNTNISSSRSSLPILVAATSPRNTSIVQTLPLLSAASSSTSNITNSNRSNQIHRNDIIPPAISKKTANEILDKSPTDKDISSNYHIIGNAGGKVSYDETSLALQKILESEVRERKNIESKKSILQEQNIVLTRELDKCQRDLNLITKEKDDLIKKLCNLKGEKLEILSLDQCEELEVQLRKSLELVIIRKEAINRDNKATALCVICQEKEKSVVLLPCRHMCLCEECSLHDQLQACPLCRRPIAHRISVYA